MIFTTPSYNNIILTIFAFINILNNNYCCGNLFIPDDEYDLLPKIYHIDSYEKCLKDAPKTYCQVTIQLMPVNSAKTLASWKYIEATKNYPNYYHHDELYHTICVEDFCESGSLIISNNDDGTLSSNDNNNVNLSLAQCYSQKYANISLKAVPIKYSCRRLNGDDGDDSISDIIVNDIRIVDVFILIAFISYLMLILISTMYDYYKTKANIVDENNCRLNYKKYLTSFSFINNWNKLTVAAQPATKHRSKNNNQQLLESVQGMRFINTVLIISTHTTVSYMVGYVSNTKYVEDIQLMNVIFYAFNYIVQSYFLLSGWFLSYNAFQKLDKLETLTIRHVFWMLINRYLRILPPLLVAIGLFSSTWLHRFYYYSPIQEVFAVPQYQQCAANWWTNLLLINNHYRPKDMCYIISWYLAADFHLYAISLMILYLIWKFKKRSPYVISLIFGLAILTGMAVTSTTTYIYNKDIVIRLRPNSLKNNLFLEIPEPLAYISTYTNMATYMVGLTLGYIISKYKDMDIRKTKLLTIVWWLIFIGFPSIAIIPTYYQYSRLVSGLLAGTLKPLYALGIGVGILGMIKGLGGRVKMLCEWRPIVFLATFSYSTYIMQWIGIFSRLCAVSAPRHISVPIIFMSIIYDVVISFLFGFIVYMLVEMPCLRLQKMTVPQVEDDVKVEDALTTKPKIK